MGFGVNMSLLVFFFLSLQGGGEVPLEKRMWSERQFAVTLINITD